MATSNIQVHDQQKGLQERLAIVDTDVHHGFRSHTDLLPYLPKVYHERLIDYGMGGGSVSYANNGGWRGYRADLYSEEQTGKPKLQAVSGGVNTADPEATRDHLLDACGIDIAVLTGGPMYGVSASPDVDYASVLCSAFNDYGIDRWLSVDKRFRLTLAICTQDPQGAAREIDRLGDHPGVCGIMMPCGAPKPFGNRFYHPIYEACARHGLAVGMHFGGEGGGINPPLTAAGFPSTYTEIRLARPSFYQVHLASFIFEGVFEKFPTLKVAMLEGGFAWVPAYRWRMDQEWKALRYQTPWVKKLPSEYIRDHVRFASQPMEDTDPKEALHKIVEWMDGDRTLMFATDYPHWDWDDPTVTFTGLSQELRQRIFVDNAHDTFRL